MKFLIIFKEEQLAWFIHDCLTRRDPLIEVHVYYDFGSRFVAGATKDCDVDNIVYEMKRHGLSMEDCSLFVMNDCDDAVVYDVACIPYVECTDEHLLRYSQEDQDLIRRWIDESSDR